MNCRSERKKYSDWVIPEDKQEKLKRSAEGIESLELRPIKCPKCNRIQFYAYSDCTGHTRFLCHRCKDEYTISYRDFHTRTSRPRPARTDYLIDP